MYWSDRSRTRGPLCRRICVAGALLLAWGGLQRANYTALDASAENMAAAAQQLPEWAAAQGYAWLETPENGLRLIRDPETPEGQATLALKAVVNHIVPQLVWYVDGKPIQVADYPYTARLTLTAGEHRIQAGLPNTPFFSRRVTIFVQ